MIARGTTELLRRMRALVAPSSVDTANNPQKEAKKGGSKGEGWGGGLRKKEIFRSTEVNEATGSEVAPPPAIVLTPTPSLTARPTQTSQEDAIRHRR